MFATFFRAFADATMVQAFAHEKASQCRIKGLLAAFLTHQEVFTEREKEKIEISRMR